MIHTRMCAYQRVTNVEHLLNVFYTFSLIPVSRETAFAPRVSILVTKAVIERALSWVNSNQKSSLHLHLSQGTQSSKNDFVD